MSFEKDIMIIVKVIDKTPSISITGEAITHGELRVILKLIEDNYFKFIQEKRNDRRVEKPKSGK